MASAGIAAVAVAAALGAAAAEPDAGGRPAAVRATVEIPGRVVLDGSSSRVAMPAVVFDHWSHRALYTCRVCHVDLGFAMRAGETRVSAETNEDGAHCGACHDGRTREDGRAVFRACWGWPRLDPARGCQRCHTGPSPGRPAGYEAFRQRMPLDVAGDVDWVAAGRRGLVRPADAIPGVTPRRAPMRIDRDVELRSAGTWMNDVTFSHRRHVSWIACELCHPDAFPMRRGAARPRMEEMRAGRHCGACHASVAFPLSTCQRCHGRVLR